MTEETGTENATETDPASGGPDPSPSPNPEPEKKDDIRAIIREELGKLRKPQGGTGDTESPKAKEARIAAEVNAEIKNTLGELTAEVKTVKKAITEEGPKKARRLTKFFWGDGDK